MSCNLKETYEKHGDIIVAVDFDDTVFDYHEVGLDLTDTLNVLRQCNKHNLTIIIYTASNKSRFEFISQYMHNVGIDIDGINENKAGLPFGNSGKIYYNILLDDKAGLNEAKTRLKEFLTEIDTSKKKQTLCQEDCHEVGISDCASCNESLNDFFKRELDRLVSIYSRESKLLETTSTTNNTCIEELRKLLTKLHSQIYTKELEK